MSRSRIIRWVSRGTLGLGVVHCVATPLFYPAYNFDALWFFGGGLAIVATGWINGQPARAGQQRWVILWNGIMTAYGLALCGIALAPQIILATMLFASLFTFQLGRELTKAKTPPPSPERQKSPPHP